MNWICLAVLGAWAVLFVSLFLVYRVVHSHILITLPLNFFFSVDLLLIWSFIALILPSTCLFKCLCMPTPKNIARWVEHVHREGGLLHGVPMHVAQTRPASKLYTRDRPSDRLCPLTPLFPLFLRSDRPIILDQPLGLCTYVSERKGRV